METTHEPQLPRQPEDGFGYAYTGATRGRTHVGSVERDTMTALCGVGIVDVGEYRPSRASLEAKLCPKCARLARAEGADPMALGWRHDVDGE